MSTFLLDRRITNVNHIHYYGDFIFYNFAGLERREASYLIDFKIHSLKGYQALCDEQL